MACQAVRGEGEGGSRPRLDEFHGERAAEAADCEAALGYGEIDGAEGGGGVAADFGGVVDEVAGNCHCDKSKIPYTRKQVPFYLFDQTMESWSATSTEMEIIGHC